MTTALSATDLAIQSAQERGTLKVERCISERLGSEYFAISDDSGLIEVYLSEADTQSRLERLLPGCAYTAFGDWIDELS